MKILLFFFTSLLLISTASTEEPSVMKAPKIDVQNMILTTINGKTFSVVDIMKKMNTALYNSHPEVYDSIPSRYQFYMTNWQYALDEIINTELVLQDSIAKGLKLTNGEIREEMEKRYGPNIIVTLENLHLTFDEAWDLLKKEMTVQRMNWYFVHSKAIQAVSPEKIRSAYQEFCQKNPSQEEWNYYMISLKSLDPKVAEEASKALSSTLQGKKEDPSSFTASFKEIEKKYPQATITISSEFKLKNAEIAPSHKASLQTLTLQSYSAPTQEMAKNDSKKICYRVFYLKGHENSKVPSFTSVENNLKNELIQKEAIHCSQDYIAKLRKEYGIEERLKLPENFEPFILR